MNVDKEKILAVKTLRYESELNLQNITLVLLGASILSALLVERLPANASKLITIIIIFIASVLFYMYFRGKLNKIIEEIKQFS